MRRQQREGKREGLIDSKKEKERFLKKQKMMEEIDNTRETDAEKERE